MAKKQRQQRILIICTHFHQDRSYKQEKITMQTMAGLHVASQIDTEKYDVKLYHESYQGPYDITQPDQADLVFLTGLQKDFDRMRQLSYIFQKQGSIVVAGGNICTLFPEFATEFFNAVSVGGVECTLEVLRDFESGTLKQIYRSPQTQVSNYIVKYELLARSGIRPQYHFVEASRGCNFKCDFCVIPAEGANHATYRIDTVVQSIERAIATSPRFSIRRLFPLLFFIDNNFSNNLPYMTELCSYLKKSKKIRGWGALITQNMLRKRDMIAMMADSKCKVLFTGIESFDNDFLDRHNKKQNKSNLDNVLDDIRFVQQQGIVLTYPYMFDPRISSVAQMKQEIQKLVELDNLTFPLFFTTVSPLVGTQLFWESAQKGELLPNLRLRDLDGQALAYGNTIDAHQDYGQFFSLLYRDTIQLCDRKTFFWNLLKKTVKMGLNHPVAMYLFYTGSLSHINESKTSSRTLIRNYIGGKDVLDPQYDRYPPNITPSDKARYFDPIAITDSNGHLSPWLKAYQPNLSSREQVA
ncbi:hypothetical protein PMG71_18315 [Roseofilum sp. BLCC_M154]|uniref:Radical SAM core domain-containing protein n=1 Tax=Roseofilum acuticapitatum BLCC-M154 TaxID=3022444 RepID=A0ABT7AWU7_9CYAN|nr:radical SAM protein [Roseofilum acuticapitatum]MDJ1171389.1 hypothetical protein [Roseofilum acuticapitatum BLCC-M154]